MKKFFTREIVTYVFFGVLSTIVSWGSYAVFSNLCLMSVFVSNLLSWICAVVFAYVTNKLWVFNSKSWAPSLVLREALSFLASRAVTGVIEIAFVPLMAHFGFDNIFYRLLRKASVTSEILFTDGIYSKIAVAVIVVILNYVFSKLIVFKQRVAPPNDEKTE